MKEIIYVYLLNEGVDVWRPVLSEKVSDDIYLLGHEEYDPETEEWQFPPDTLVYVKMRKLSRGSVLVAVELVNSMEK